MVRLLKKIASKSDHEQFRHATIVLKGGAVISYGTNLGKRHSEVVALSKIWPNKRKGCRIINVRIRRDGSYGNSKPCPKCMAFLKENGIISVAYTCPDFTGGPLGFTQRDRI